MTEYHKIHAVYKRDHKTGKFVNEFSRPEFACLYDAVWVAEEKIDGTNFRVIWQDGKRTFGGRTDKAHLPAGVVAYAEEKFTVDKLSEAFGEFTDYPVVLYGEGCGPKIQKVGDVYGDTQRVILFDVRVGSIWLQRPSVNDIACKFGVDCTVVTGFAATLSCIEKLVAAKNLDDCAFAGNQAEGYVCRPMGDFLDRRGYRIITKVKVRDYV